MKTFTSLLESKNLNEFKEVNPELPIPKNNKELRKLVIQLMKIRGNN